MRWQPSSPGPSPPVRAPCSASSPCFSSSSNGFHWFATAAGSPDSIPHDGRNSSIDCSAALCCSCGADSGACEPSRSEEHTSELQSRLHLVCRLLLEKKKNKQISRNLMISSHDKTLWH